MVNGMPNEVTDPALLSKLNNVSPKEVTDPKLLSKLNTDKPESGFDTAVKNVFSNPKETSDLKNSNSDLASQFWNGSAQAGIGGMQLLNELGVNTMPAYVDGQIKLVPVTGKKLADIQKGLEKQEGGGVEGWLARQAMNPINYIAGPEKLGIGLKSGLQSMISSAVAPSDDPNKTIGKRAKDTLIAGPLGFATGKVVKGVGQAGSKLLDIGSTKTVTPSTDPVSTLKWIKNFVMDTPKGSFKVSKEDQSLYNAAKKIGLDIQGKEPKQIFSEIKDWYGKNINEISLAQHHGIVPGETHPIAANFAISEEYRKSNQMVNDAYKKAYEIGDKEHIQAEGIKESLDQVIAGMKAKASARGLDPKFDTALDKLESLREEIGGGHTPSINEALGFTPKKPDVVTASWLGELKKTLNQYHVPEPLRTSKSTPYSSLGAKVREELKKTSPEFQKQLSRADMRYTEQERIFGNENLKKFWNGKADFDAYKLVKERGGNLNVDTKKRAEKLLDNIKTPADIDTLKQALPRDIFDSVRSAKFYQIMSKAGLDADAIDKNHDLVIKILGNDQKSIQTVDAIKTAVEQMNQRGVGNLNPAALEQKDNLIQRSLRTVFSLATGHKLYAIKHAMEAAQAEPTGAVRQRVSDYAKDLTKAAPKKEYIPGPIIKGVSKPLSTAVGEQTQ
jgi:hypothetical protein